MLKGVAASSGGGAPSGPAGGALAGTYPNPTLAPTVATTAHGIVIPPSGSVVAAVSHTGDTSEFVLATIPVPAIPAGARLRLTTIISKSGTAGAYTQKAYYGATSSGTGGTLYLNTATSTTLILGSRVQVEILNRTTSSQIAYGASLGATNVSGWGNSSTGPNTSAVTTTGATELNITGTLANSGDTITLEGYLLEVILP